MSALIACTVAAINVCGADEPTLPPRPPEQPTSGPGGAAAVHASVRKLGPFRDGARAYWLYEPDRPAPASAPLVVFLHGYSGVNARVYGGWIDHIVRRGNTVLYPIYQTGWGEPEKYTGNALAAVKDAFRVLRSEPGHVRPNSDGRWAIVGHSLGCPIGANIAAAAEREGLPRPRALMACNAGNANSLFKTIPSVLRDPRELPDLLLLVVAGADDHMVGETTGREIFDRATGVLPANKNFVLVESDRTGRPALEADHLAPLAMDSLYDNGAALGSFGESTGATRRRSGGGGETTNGEFTATDALDYYGYWKWFDGLTDAAFFGRNREFALGDTPEQRFMGTWSDGSPVRPVKVELGK